MQPYSRNAFLSFLSAPDLAAVHRQLAPFGLRLGDCLLRPHDTIEYVTFPHSGIVAMTMPSKEGAGIAAFLVGNDGFVGGFAAAALACAGGEARVHLDGEASRMSAAAFRHLLDQSPSARQLAARFDSAMLAQAQQTAVCNAVHPVEARLCRWLLEVQDRTGSSKIPLTQSTFAQMLGVRRTTVTLIAGRLEASGMIEGHADICKSLITRNSNGTAASATAKSAPTSQGYLQAPASQRPRARTLPALASRSIGSNHQRRRVALRSGKETPAGVLATVRPKRGKNGTLAL